MKFKKIVPVARLQLPGQRLNFCKMSGVGKILSISYQPLMFDNFHNLIKSYRLSNSIDSLPTNNIEIGCSFDPYHRVFQDKNIDPFDCLTYLHKNLLITNIRLSIRWSKVWKNNKLNFSSYKKYFDYCFKNNLKIILNVGPIKSMRWPEEHIPKEFRKYVKEEETISLNHTIAPFALIYLEELLGFIKNEYSQYSQNIIAIQGDNESFNRFGQFRLLISQEFELKVFEVIKKFFPDKLLFVNSDGLKDLNNIFSLIENQNSKFIVGINYYYKVKYQHRIPILNKLDNIFIHNLYSISPERFKQIVSEKDYQIEISELQGEPWWPNALTPGNSFNEFVFTLLRSLFLKPETQEDILIRYWGIEDFICRFFKKEDTSENRKIKELIIQINSRR